MERKREWDRAYRYKKRREAAIFMREFKFCANCEECGDTWDLEFHHRDPSTKRYKVSTMVHRGMAIRNIWKEMEKCAVLCHHCHRLIHDGDPSHPYFVGGMSSDFDPLIYDNSSSELGKKSESEACA